jgi:hypothetical protein
MFYIDISEEWWWWLLLDIDIIGITVTLEVLELASQIRVEQILS